MNACAATTPNRARRKSNAAAYPWIEDCNDAPSDRKISTAHALRCSSAYLTSVAVTANRAVSQSIDHLAAGPALHLDTKSRSNDFWPRGKARRQSNRVGDLRYIKVHF
jgi:hypothetical protein